MRMLTATLATMLAVVGSAAAFAAEDSLMKEAQGLFQPIPEKPPAVKGVAATPAMVELGKALYFDPRLSESHNISCNTCHQIGLGGVDMLPTSIGHKSQKGNRNAPTVLNSVFNTPSSGMAAPPTSRNRLAVRSRTRSRWRSPISTRSRC